MLAVPRDVFVRYAGALVDAGCFGRVFSMMPSRSSQHTAIAARAWALHGYQSVHMPHTYASALMATDSRAALREQELPWPAFEIRVPGGLLASSHGPVLDMIVCQIPREIVMVGEYASHRLLVVYRDAVSQGVQTFRSLVDMFEEGPKAGPGDTPPALLDLMDEDLESRLWSLITRLVGGVVLAIAAARTESPTAYAARQPKVKHGRVVPNSFALGRALKLDCRASIQEFLEGRRHSAPKVTTLVRGHWRDQAHGPGRLLRKPLWIQPHYRGEGPLLVRPTLLGGAP